MAPDPEARPSIMSEQQHHHVRFAPQAPSNPTGPAILELEEMSRGSSHSNSSNKTKQNNNSNNRPPKRPHSHRSTRQRHHPPAADHHQETGWSSSNNRDYYDDDASVMTNGSSVASGGSNTNNSIRNKSMSPIRDDIEQPLLHRQRKHQTGNNRWLDFKIHMSYLCNVLTLTLPVVFMPVIAQEQTDMSPAAYVAEAASISVLGGALGKFVNGFVVQLLGGRKSAIYYHLLLCFFSMSLSVSSPRHAGWIFAGMEFCASIQWTSCSVVLSNHYEFDPSAMAHAITGLGMASNLGNLAAKAFGTTLLLQQVSWRTVAVCGAFIATAGAAFSAFVSERPVWALPELTSSSRKLDTKNIMQSIRAVLGSPMFWIVGIAHAVAYLARTSDKVLGGFFQEASGLAPSICGGLTTSVTVGFVFGLYTSRNFHSLTHVSQKTRMLSQRYMMAVISVLTLAVCANNEFGKLLGSPYLIAAAITLATGAMASNLSFQVYQIPNLVANTFGENQPICLSFLDGMGYLLSAPIWAITSSIVSHPSLEDDGWSVAWILLAAFFTFGSCLMMRAIPTVLRKQPK